MLTEQLLGPRGLTYHATGFDRRDLLQAICQTLPPGAPVTHRWLQDTADQVFAHRDIIPLLADPDTGARWTTRELLQTESAGLRLADQLRAQPPVAEQRPITTEQRPLTQRYVPPLPHN